MRRLAALALTSVVVSACEGEGLARVAPRIAFAPDPVVAAATAIGAESKVTARIDNLGDLALEIGALELEGGDEWTVEAPGLPGRVAPGESRPLTLTYAPQGPARAATLIVRSNDPERPVVRVPLEGALRPGPAIVLCVSRAGADPQCTAATDSVDLGLVRVGQVVTATVMVRSVGDAPV